MRAGFLVLSWPIVLGCDASGVVVEVGSDVTKFKVGDSVFGCTRLGAPGYGTFQEYVCPVRTYDKKYNASGLTSGCWIN